MAAMLHRLAENEVARVLAKLPEDTRLAAEECAVCYDAGSEDFETLGLSKAWIVCNRHPANQRICPVSRST